MGLELARIRRPSPIVVVSPKPERSESPKKAKSRKKNETADDGGGFVSAALNGP